MDSAAGAAAAAVLQYKWGTLLGTFCSIHNATTSLPLLQLQQQKKQ